MARSRPVKAWRSAATARRRPARGWSESTPSSSAGASLILSWGGRGASSTSATPRSLAVCVETSSWWAAIGAAMARMAAMPAWRTASSRAASRGVRSGSRSPPSAVSARPMPTPASACGITVHHRLALGQPGQREHAAADQRAARGRARARVAAQARAAERRQRG